MIDAEKSRQQLLQELEGLRGQVEELKAALADRQAAQALGAREARFRAVFERTAIGIVLSDHSGRVLEANPAMQRMLGYDAGELRRLTFTVATHPDDLPLNLQLARELLAGKRNTYQIEKRLIRKDGGVLWVRVTASLVRGSEGEPQLVISMAEDITERKQLQQRLLRAQRLETAGRIAGQVAHDFNNLLGPVTTYPDLIKMELPEDHPALRYCDAMLAAAEQMADLSENLMTLGRRGILDQQPTDINRLVELALAQMERGTDRLEIVTQLAPDLLHVSGSPTQLLRVITNLLANAREAMQQGGRIAVTTDNVYVDSPMGSHNLVEVGEYVRLQVEDTGRGIPPEIRDKIFEPFFTTKAKDTRRGSGLGLSIVQAIVEDHRGYLDLESEMGRGTTFSIYLPACREPLVGKETEGLESGNERILVVDDDRLQREVLRESLEKLGYRVETATGGEQALAYLKEHPADLMILDMVMPGGMDGTETYRGALEVVPGQRAIIVSGFAASERVAQAQAMGAGAYLRKPVKLEILARAVREELDR